LPPFLERGRAWGFAVNLYTLRSQTNWGIGDFGDLRAFVELSARLGANLIGLNPLHALHAVDPEAASPYAPTSRYFLNPIYLAIPAIPEFARDARARAIVAEPSFARELAAAREAPHVAYATVARLKDRVLEALFTGFDADADPARRATFAAFCARGGERLERFARYEALTEAFASDEGRVRGWLTWPDAYRDPTSDDVARFARERADRVTYAKFRQWLADEQLAEAGTRARALGIGLYRDLAVGVDLNSADVWSDRAAYVLDEEVGAPPDALGPLGQNWGLPPPEPAALVEGEGERFTALLEANMAHAGAVRIDHVMALVRLFRIPRGKTPHDGHYVPYPLDDLLAVLARASERHACLVVGEDLGTVPDGFRERMERERILSYRLLYFERGDDGSFLGPEHYPELALATVGTHDLPTLAGWASGRDIEVRRRIGALSDEIAAAAREIRAADVGRLVEMLRAGGDLAVDDAPPNDADLALGAYRFLARTRARIVLVQLDDAVGEFEQINLPGTFSEYPNWRRKINIDLERIAVDSRIAAIAADVGERIRGGANA
jgi:4-alpha-glucanotransferase